MAHSRRFVAVAGFLALVSGACSTSQRLTEFSKACDVAPNDLVASILGIDVPNGEPMRGDAPGTAAGCIWELPDGRDVVIWVDDVEGPAMFASQGDAARLQAGTTAITEPNIDGVESVQRSSNDQSIGAWLLVDGKTYINADILASGSTSFTADDAARKLALAAADVLRDQ